jgi:UDP-GlcNAc:undecaprenyl-phosphate GlcNAc-1-phosphate transferase
MRWYDPKSPRKIHNGEIPRIGGAGIFISLAVTVCLFSIPGVISSAARQIPIIQNLPFIIGLCIIFLAGILDDFKNLRARYKLILQIIAAGIVIAGGFRFSSFTLPFGLTISNTFVRYGISLFWIVGAANAINLIDGMDGLAGGISAIAALFWGIISLQTGHTSAAVAAFVLFGSIAGFLVFNKPPAKVFMGDSGSLLIGYILAVLPLMEQGKESSTETLLLGVTILVIPFFDTVSAVFRRIRLKKRISEPDKDHIHHKFLKLGLSVHKILIIIYSFCIFTGAAAFFWAVYPEYLNIYFLPLTWIPTLVLFRFLHARHWKVQFKENVLREARPQTSPSHND